MIFQCLKNGLFAAAEGQVTVFWSNRQGLGANLEIMGLATIDSHSQKEHTEHGPQNPQVSCGSIIANPIIYRLVPRPSRFENRHMFINRARDTAFRTCALSSKQNGGRKGTL